MAIITYAEQIRLLARQERVDLYDAVREAGIARTTYHRSIIGKQPLRLDTAIVLERTIRDMSAR